MIEYLDLYFYFGGKWKYDSELIYVGGHVNIQKHFDVDFLSFLDIASEFESHYGYKEVKAVYGREYGVGKNSRFTLIESDFGIRILMNIVSPDCNAVDFYVEEPIEPLSDDFDDEWIHKIIDFCDKQDARIGEGGGSGTCDVVEARVIERVVNEEAERKESGSDYTKYAYPSGDTSESSDDEFQDDIYNVVDENEDSSDGDELRDFNDIDARYMTKFSMNDDRPTFRLGMTFANALEVRQAITKYGISRGVSLKYIKNEPSRIRVRCEEGCPFLLLVSKSGSQPGLCVKTFSEEHTCFRIFNNARCFTRFIASHFKSRILNKVDYKMKDMKYDAEAELRCNVSFFKCKRARKLVLDEFTGRFTTEFSELEPYAAELMKSNPGSVVRLELCNDEL